MCVCAELLSRVRLFVTLWSVVHPVPLSMGFSMAGKNPGMCCHTLLQQTFPTQGLNQRLSYLLHCRQYLYP